MSVACSCCGGTGKYYPLYGPPKPCRTCKRKSGDVQIKFTVPDELRVSIEDVAVLLDGLLARLRVGGARIEAVELKLNSVKMALNEHGDMDIAYPEVGFPYP